MAKEGSIERIAKIQELAARNAAIYEADVLVANAKRKVEKLEAQLAGAKDSLADLVKARKGIR